MLFGVVGGLQRVAAEPRERRPLVAYRPAGAVEFELREPPKELLTSTETFLEQGLPVIARALAQVNAGCAGLLLPVRTLDGAPAICPFLDAEAMVVVAAEDLGRGVASAGVVCAMHELPDGWREAHPEIDWLAGLLRASVARRPLELDESQSA